MSDARLKLAEVLVLIVIWGTAICALLTPGPDPSAYAARPCAGAG